MRTRVVSVVGLSLGCAAAAWADTPAGMASELIRNPLAPAATLALGAVGGWLLGHRGVRPWRLRADQAVAALNEAQAQLVRKEKLAVLGQLAGSVGHELRNPLAVMTNAVYYLEMVQPEAQNDIREYHAILRTQIALSERIVTDLLDFSRVRAPQLETVAVARLVEDQLARLPLAPDVTVSRALPDSDVTVRVDAVQIGQVLYNLLLNAVQAMAGGGVLTVSARADGDRVLVVVADTGPGIPPGFEQKIFEALFTTKARGIGLGLAVSRSLAEANHGRLDVASRPGVGATFTLTLPAAGAGAAA